MDNAFATELKTLLAEGRKIEAIKRYREEFGVGLNEAKEAVEALAEDGEMPQIERGDPGYVEGEIVTLLEQGRKLEAIKLYRDHAQAGLKEAKESVEAIAAKHGIPAASGSGCLGMILWVWLVLAALSSVSHPS